MVKRPKLDNVGETDPENEVETSFVPGEGEANPEGNSPEVGEADVSQDVADQEAAGVADKPTRPAATPAANGGNNPRTVSPKTQYNNLKNKVLGLGKLHGGGKTSMIALAEAVVEAAQDGAITPEQTSEVYDKFKEGVTKASSYEDAGEVSDEAAMGAAPAKSLEQQLSKLRQFVYLGNKYESDALDLVRKARNMHIELLRVANGSADAKKGVKPGSTYAILVDVARAQLKKQKDAVEAGKKTGVKHTGLAPVLTDDELRGLMTQEVKEPVDKTGEDYLLDTLIKAKATYKGSDKRNAITSEELANAIEWLRQALAKAAPDLLSQHDAEELQAQQAKAQAAADRAEAERVKAEKAAQPKPTKAERQAALAAHPLHNDEALQAGVR
jgi:hypothetical protein